MPSLYITGFIIGFAKPNDATSYSNIIQKVENLSLKGSILNWY